MTRTDTIGKLLAVAALMYLSSGASFAQDDDEGSVTQGDDARYLRVTHVSFKPGQRESAMQIIREHFMVAGEKAGTPDPILAIHYQSGKWDATFVWELAGGMADLEWYRSPNNIKWFAALAEISGGTDEAEEILMNYFSKVANSVTEVGHHHVAEAE